MFPRTISPGSVSSFFFSFFYRYLTLYFLLTSKIIFTLLCWGQLVTTQWVTTCWTLTMRRKKRQSSRNLTSKSSASSFHPLRCCSLYRRLTFRHVAPVLYRRLFERIAKYFCRFLTRLNEKEICLVNHKIEIIMNRISLNEQIWGYHVPIHLL